MDTHEVKCEEIFAMEDIVDRNAAHVNEVRENQYACVEPGHCHAESTKQSYCSKGSLAEASHILSEDVGNVVKVHHDGTS